MPPAAPSEKPSRDHTLSRVEQGLAIAALLILVVLKWFYLEAMQVNSDEPQHLHVAWSWTQGMVQYRDFFDNHTPLFHLLSAPLIHWLGERADILFYMRLAMIPISVASLGCIYLITRRLYSARVAIWAAIFAGLHPFVLPISAEYRTDNFWALCWFIALTWMLTGRATPKRFFIAGLFLGAAFSVSMKTSLLLLSFGIAAGLVWGARLWAGEKTLLPLLKRNALATLGGLIVIPGILLAYFASENALEAIGYCVFEHNIVPGMKPKGNMIRWNFPLLLPFILIGGWLFYHLAPSREAGTRRAIAAMGAAFSMALLMAYWPLVTRQDFTAIAPPFFISVAPIIMGIASRFRKSGGALLQQGISKPLGWAFVAAALLIPMSVVAYEVERCYNLWRWTSDGLGSFESQLAPKLLLCKPDEYIFDAKGESIFRRRSYYYVLERVTLTRLKRDLMENTIEKDILEKDTAVVCFSRIPDTIQEELERFYLHAHGATWVAGQIFNKGATEEARTPHRFKLPIASQYTFIDQDGPITGTLDGTPISGSVELSKGEYEFIPDQPAKEIAIILSTAIENDFNPLKPPAPKARMTDKAKAEQDREEALPKQVILTNPFSRKKIRH